MGLRVEKVELDQNLGDAIMGIFSRIFGGGEKATGTSARLATSASSSGSGRAIDEDLMDKLVGAMMAREKGRREGTFETAGKNIQKIICSDDECPCTDQRQLVLGKDAYLFISPEVVSFRRSCVSLLELEMKVSGLSSPMDMLAAVSHSMPKYLCETGARRRGLDLAVALADGQEAAKTGFVPLRPTPKGAVNEGVVGIKIESFGIYQAEIKEVSASHDAASGFRNKIGKISEAERTDRIPLRRGVVFGLTVVTTGRAEGTSVNLKIIWRFPPPGLKNPQTGEVHLCDEFFDQFEFGQAQIIHYRFDAEFELLLGQWKCEIWDGMKLLADKSFQMEAIDDSVGSIPLPRSSAPKTGQSKSEKSEGEDALLSLVRDLMSSDSSTRDGALVATRQLANSGNRRGVDALEEAIRRKAGTNSVEFHTPGIAVFEFSDLLTARKSLLEIACRHAICREAKKVGSLLSKIDMQSSESVRALLTDLRRIGGEDQAHQFQLVGTHMQAVAGYKSHGRA
jgi:hypothetical protein